MTIPPIDIGNFALASSWFLSTLAIATGAFGAWRERRDFTSSAKKSLTASLLLASVSLLALAAAFLSGDFRYTYVWQNSNLSMSPLYRLSAIWGGMDGSLLLWTWFMALFTVLALETSSGVPRRVVAWAVPVFAFALQYFLLIVLFFTNPFRYVPTGVVPADGSGLNPLLQNPSMLIHPPLLYLGFTGFLVPCAFCLGALASGDLSLSWIRCTRKWTLVAWTFLTAGIVLGGNWAYLELGWGGFWAWDPVENSSFLPWLTGTAFLHSIMVQERRGMLKIWNVALCVGTYLLTVFGTFLTRSGVVESVHAFANTDVGWVFLLFIAIMVALSILLVFLRRRELRPEDRIESFFSREAAFLLNNLLLVAICFATLWGVLFPVITEALGQKKAVVGPPFFNRVNVPLFLALLFLMSYGPLASWRTANPRALFRLFAVPCVLSSVCVVLFLALDPGRPLAALAFGLGALALFTVGREFHRGTRVQQAASGERAGGALVRLVKRRPRRYGGFLVHAGVAVMAIAITASMAYKIEKDLVLEPGDTASVGPYRLELAALREEVRENHEALIAEVIVRRDGSEDVLAILKPEHRFYPVGEQATTEVDIRMTPLDDLYVAFAGLSAPSGGMPKETSPRAVFKVFRNPLQLWLWVGALVVLLGSGVALAPRLSPVLLFERFRVRAPREASRG